MTEEIHADHDLVRKEFATLRRVKGPLIFVDRVDGAGYDHIVEVTDPAGETRLGRVLEVREELVVAQLFTGTGGLDLSHTRLRLTGEVASLDVSLEMLGRTLDGSGRPIDGGPLVHPEHSRDINGLPLNPSVRAQPVDLIRTGFSAIDGMNTLSRGQKLPVLSASGLPGNELLARIVAQAAVSDEDEEMADDAAPQGFAVVFGGIGITRREADFFIESFRESGIMDRTIVFINHADDPTIERLLTPRAALTAAEFLAFEKHFDVLVVLTDMTNYCDALREISAAREEVPGRRGYPGYMYSDLAGIYERAGRIRGEPGSLTQLILLTMPDDDITHPIPDLTGYITEGQIVLSRDLHQRGISPPIDVLPSLSRLMDSAIGEGRTRPEHRVLVDQLYSLYAEGRVLRQLVAIIGEEALTEEDERIMAFSDRFEKEFIGHGEVERSIAATLDLAWDLLQPFPARSLKRIPRNVLEEFHT